MNFLELGLSEQTVRAIEEFGIQEPTTVQSDVIPSILEGKDVFTMLRKAAAKRCLTFFRWWTSSVPKARKTS